MRGKDVREVFETALPNEALEPIIVSSGFQTRERKLDARLFIRSAIIAASSGHGSRQAEVFRHYFGAGGEDVVRGAGYKWFGAADRSQKARDRT